MKSLRLPGVFLAVIAMAGVAPSSFAGSERWIMTMTSDRMVQENLIHVRFIGPDGGALESDAMKNMVVRERDCESGQALKMVKDYKMGFAPEDKLVGIFLFPHAWKSKTLCFSIPDVGKVEKNMAVEVNSGHSIQLKVMP